MEGKIKNEVHTSLSGKEFEPMVIRRVSMPFLHWVAIISGDNLDPLDSIIKLFWKKEYIRGKVYSIQDIRNLAGLLQDYIIEAFPKLEGCAVIFSADKMIVSSLAGDFMVHEQCRLELFQLLNLSTQM